MNTFQELVLTLPIELKYKIITYLDIDSRMALGIITKMRKPNFIENISSKLKPVTTFSNINSEIITSFINLKTLYVLRHQIYNDSICYYVEHNMYSLFNNTNNNLYLRLHLPDIYISRTEDKEEYTIFYKNNVTYLSTTQ